MEPPRDKLQLAGAVTFLFWPLRLQPLSLFSLHCSGETQRGWRGALWGAASGVELPSPSPGPWIVATTPPLLNPLFPKDELTSSFPEKIKIPHLPQTRSRCYTSDPMGMKGLLVPVEQCGALFPNFR